MYEALMQGGRTRVRPILMTAIATMLALMPLALGLSEGEIIASELATVVIGGLFTSTFLTLIVVPVVYSLVEDAKGRTSRAFGRGGEDDGVSAEPAVS
jgi:HAE1 family hydrophobic/amphiphilic exporter-1